MEATLRTTEIKDDSKQLMRMPIPTSSISLPTEVTGIPMCIEKANATGTDIVEVTGEEFKIPANFTEPGR